MMTDDTGQYSEEDIFNFYHEEGLRETHHQKNMLKNEWARHRMEYLKDQMRPYVEDAWCLDLGCAEGLYCKWMIETGARLVFGIEISLPKLSRAEQHPNIIYMHGSWDHIPFIRQIFDVTLLTEGLEHSLDPSHLIRKAMNVSKRMFVSVPIREEKNPKPFDPRPKAPPSGHLHAFRRDGLFNLFSDYEIEHYHESQYGYAVLVVTHKQPIDKHAVMR